MTMDFWYFIGLMNELVDALKKYIASKILCIIDEIHTIIVLHYLALIIASKNIFG